MCFIRLQKAFLLILQRARKTKNGAGRGTVNFRTPCHENSRLLLLLPEVSMLPSNLNVPAG